MAQAPNTQTPAAGQPGNEAGNNTPQPKKYAGKYNSLEEAVELGYGGLERGFNELNEKFSNMTRLLEAAVAPQEPVPQVGPSNYSQPGYDLYGRGTPNAAQNYTVDFLTNPDAHLRAREDAMLNKVAGIVQNTVTNAMAVADFKLHNADLVKHEPLVRTFMAQTDARKSISERLEEAGKAARAYIAQNFQQPVNTPPAGNDYVEPPHGAITRYAPGSPPPAPSNTTEDEKALIDYLNDRNAMKAQNMGTGYDPNPK